MQPAKSKEYALTGLAEKINAAHDKLVRTIRTGLERARDIGLLLLQAKEQCDHGNWIPWLRGNVNVTERTAQRYMQIAEGWDRLQELAKATSVPLLGVREAIDLLSEPLGPQDHCDDDDAPEDGPDPEEEEHPPKEKESDPPKPGTPVPKAARKLEYQGVSVPADANGEPPDDDDSSAPHAPLVPPLDRLGVPIPESSLPAFESRTLYNDARRLLRQLDSTLDALARSPAGHHIRPRLSHKVTSEKDVYTSANIDALKRDLRFTEPFASVCPACGPAAVPAPDCRSCKGSGWVPRENWRQARQEQRDRVLALKVAEPDPQEGGEE